MSQSNQSHIPTVVDLEHSTIPVSGKERSDLTILRYMVKRTYARLLDLPSGVTLPALDYVEERRNRTHRIVIYKPQELLQGSDLFFVGFVSQAQDQVGLTILQELHRVDKLLVTEVASNPGLFSYSSLEVHRGHWYNLVLLGDCTAKQYFRNLSLHTYAAHQLAAYYYLWIRLHNGIMPGGLLSETMILQSTKYYTFHCPALEESNSEETGDKVYE
ncbi:MAG: hypothetical protein ABI406_17990 [Ktedonobacteraceae bacterium]